jgi:predicted regulator of Ras-like GTPase activity (Roadblock/LC7/MglB family)
MTDIKNILLSNAASIYGFFLGNSDGEILKERVFNDEFCPQLILKNVVKAICSFAEETKISNHGTIVLSRSSITFNKYLDIVFVLNHRISDTKEVKTLLKTIIEFFEEKSRSKFYSRNQSEVFSGASSAFEKVVDDLFKDVRAEQDKLKQKRQEIAAATKKGSSSEEELSITTKEEILPLKEKSAGKGQKEVLTNLTYSLRHSFKGISHLIIVEHDSTNAKVYFHDGELTEHYVDGTMEVIQKYLEDIIAIMKDENLKNVIEIAEDYKLTFTPMDADHFLYIIAKKEVNLVLLSPILRRISSRINQAIHNSS